MTRTVAIIRGTLVLVCMLGGTGWVLWYCLKKSEDAARLVWKWALTCVVLAAMFASPWFLGPFAVPGSALFGLVLALIWARSIGALVAKPLVGMFDGGATPPDPKPLYSIAIAKRNRGRYQEAIYDIYEQLAKFPTDVQGLHLLAEIQAEHLHDLPAAEITLQRLCNDPAQLPQNVALALHQLADWHLKLVDDSDAAQADLQQIIDRFPETEMAQTAAQRIAHLSDRLKLDAVRERRPIPVPKGVEYLSQVKDQSVLRPKAEAPEVLAEQYTAHLEAHPLDSDVREKLAVLYAKELGRLDLAVEQLEILIHQPTESHKHIAHWLNVLVDLLVCHGEDLEAAREALQRIVDLNPASAAAEVARNRLGLLKLEFRGKEKGQVIKLGPCTGEKK